MCTLPAWAAKAGKKASKPRPPRPLRPGQYFWLPELSPTGPVVVAVNLYTQHVQLYRNGVAIGYSSISSGRPGYGTPVGLFNVLQKNRHHRSNKYDDAPMPWMVRLTWDGVAFHAGALPGYPASHGCIRLPAQFASKLFGAIRYNDNVLVVRQEMSEGQQPLTTLAPIDPQGKPMVHGDMLQGVPWWAPEPEPEPAPLEIAPLETTPLDVALAASAAEPAAEPASAPAPVASEPQKPVEPPQPLALLASTSQQLLFVLREGKVFAAAPLPEATFETVKTALDGRRLLLWGDDERWTALDKVPRKRRAQKGAEALDDTPVEPLDDTVWRDALPAGEFAARLRELLVPGSTLLLSDLPAVGDVHTAAWEAKDKRYFA
ncbi:MAG: L,D-transpeptidase family protein [Ottowia sp.]|nr:L,D-transpeptidase family protein [Ottowia sp.]